MSKVSRNGAVTFGLALAVVLGLVAWGFVSLNNTLGEEDDALFGVVGVQQSFGGIGIEITVKEGFITVVNALEGTPAAEAGVEAGDRIVQIDDEPLGDDTRIEDVVSKLRGTPGTEVNLTVKRGEDTKTFTIKRGRIKFPSPRVSVIERKVPGIPTPWQQECPKCTWRGDGSANYCPQCGSKLEKDQSQKPEDLQPFDQDWLWKRWKSTEELEQYRDALRRLEETRKDLWRSFPQPPALERDFPEKRFLWRWGGPEEGLFNLRVPKWQEKADEFGMDMDVKETDDAITIKCDIPGMKKEDIDITLKGKVLTIEGKREVEEETKDENGKTVRKERRFGSFSRSFTLPGKVKTDEVKTSYEDGVLIIVIPKAKEEPEEKEIKFKVGTI